jgi:DNA-directed RNA polymerase subunit omega
MARVTVEDCLNNVDSRFTLVHLAVRRVLQLRHGAPLTLENTKGNKEVVLALREIAARTINVDNIREIEETSEPAALPEAETEKIEIREIMQEATSYNVSLEYGASDEYFAEEPPPDDTREE